MASSDSEDVVDPVCGEVFPPALATFKSEHRGHTAYFCSVTCKESFDADPERYPPADLEEA